MVLFCVVMLTRMDRLVNSFAIWAIQSREARIASVLKMAGVVNSLNVSRFAADKWNMFIMARLNAQTKTSSALSVQTNAIPDSSLLDLASGHLFFHTNFQC